MQDAIQRRADSGAVGTGLAVHQRRVLDALEELAHHAYLGHLGRIARVQLDAVQHDAELLADLALEEVGAVVVLAAQVDDGLEPVLAMVLADLCRAGLAGAEHAAAKIVEVVVDRPHETVVHRVHVEPGEKRPQGLLMSFIEGPAQCRPGTPAPPAVWECAFAAAAGDEVGACLPSSASASAPGSRTPSRPPAGGVQSQRVVVAVIRQVDQQQPVAEPAGRLDLAEPAHVEGFEGAEHHHYPLAGCAPGPVRWPPGPPPAALAPPACARRASRSSSVLTVAVPSLPTTIPRRHVGGGGRIVQRQPHCHAAAQRCDHGIAGAGHIEHLARPGRQVAGRLAALEDGHAAFAAGHHQRLQVQLLAQGGALGDEGRVVRAGADDGLELGRLGFTTVAPA